MIISHRHKFILLKTKKTASSAMEIALSRVCGPDDIITPTRADLGAERAIAGQNYRIEHPAKPKIKLWRTLLRRPERYYHPTVGYYEHIPGWRVRTYVGEDVWKNYFKFCFERNPWDRQVSMYFYKTRNMKKRPSFKSFMSHIKRAYVPNFDIYAIDNEISVDRVGRYERVDSDFQEIVHHLGLTEEVVLPQANVTKGKTVKSYRDIYCDETRALVDKWYQREIEEFGYEF